MKYLITRFGGMGDIFPIAVVAKQLHDKGHIVDLALRADGPIKQTDFLLNCDYINKLIDYYQVGPWGNRVIEYRDGLKTIETIYDEYDEVIDYMWITEGNDKCKSTKTNKFTDLWKHSRNSNWTNWYDLHLSWANIDPSKVPQEDKRPVLKLSWEEQKMVSRVKKKYSKVIGVHSVASSLARTWYQAVDLIPLLQKEYKDALIVAWDPSKNDWLLLSGKSGEIKIASDSPIRRSMMITALCDVYLTVDTGFSHVAEALGVKSICLYSTVPSWTRSRYYKHQTVVDNGIENPEYYTFSLRAGDPLNIEEGLSNLSDREKKLKDLMDRRVQPQEIAKELNTDAQGLSIEIDCLKKKIDSFERIQSKSLSKITPELMLEKIKELL